jgi:endonuclease/exonuclease/phosphatase family metal-dependent hydrolase
VSFRLLTYNICRGGRGRGERLAAVVRACAPDLVVLQEATRPPEVERLAARTGMQQWVSRPRESLGFMARRAVKEYVWHRPRVSRHAFLEIIPAETDTPVFGVHLSAVHAAWTERRRTLELQALLRNIQAQERGFHFLTGDFNTLAPGELLDIRKLPRRLRALVWLSGGRVRWRTIQLVLNAGYADTYRRLHPETPGLTFPTWDPHVRLDYVFAPADGARRIASCEVVTVDPAAGASDHFPLLAQLRE